MGDVIVLKSGDDRPESVWLYCITEEGCEETGPCKVGVATYFDKRMSSLQGGNWRRLVAVWQVRIPERSRALHVEGYCLSMHRPSIYTASAEEREKLRSEWINVTPTKALETALRVLNAESEEFRREASE